MAVVADLLGIAHRSPVGRTTLVGVGSRRKKERRYPELVGVGARSRLVVLGEMCGFVAVMRTQAEWSWRRRWGSILVRRCKSCCFLELPPASNGADGEVRHLHEGAGSPRGYGMFPRAGL